MLAVAVWCSAVGTVYAATNDSSATMDAANLTRDANAYTDTDGIDLYLQAHLNGARQGRLMHFRKRGDALYASHYVLQKLGFVLPADTPNPVALHSLAGVRVDFDSAMQTVAIRAPLSLLDLGTTVRSDTRAVDLEATASLGLLFNYNLHASHSNNGNTALSAFTEQRLFGTFGVLENTLLTRSGGRGQDWDTNTVRLDSYWQTYFPKQMVSVTVGDALTRSLPWTRATRLAGLTISRDFGLQPYRPTIPLQSFVGKAVVPSEVELYIDGIRQYSGQVPAGPFELNINPSTSGIANAQLFVTNALGQTSTLDYQFYSGGNLLQPGLADWSASLGFVRRNYGIESFDYADDPVFSGFFRYGVTDWLTGATQLQATDGLVNAGIGGVWLLGDYGVMNGSFAASSTDGTSGSQFAAGYDWHNRYLGLGFDMQTTNGDYRDIGSLYGALFPEYSASAHISVSPPYVGSFGLNYVALRYPGADTAEYANASWYKTFNGNISLGVNLSKNLSDRDDFAASLTFSWFPDTDTSYYASADYDNDDYRYSVGASHPIPANGGFGWRVQANGGDRFTGGYAQAGYLGRYGRVSGGVNVLDNDQHYLFADATGSLVLMNGDVFAAQRVYQSFAVVSTDGIANVPVTRENILIGETNDSGNLLVTDLRPWQKNQLGIKTLQLPANLKIDTVEQTAVPRGGAGIVVEFPIQEIRAASIRLVDAEGQPLPVGSVAHANDNAGKGRVVGYGGMVYFDDLKPGSNRLEVITSKGEHCATHFSWRSTGDAVPLIGPLVCTTEH